MKVEKNKGRTLREQVKGIKIKKSRIENVKAKNKTKSKFVYKSDLASKGTSAKDKKNYSREKGIKSESKSSVKLNKGKLEKNKGISDRKNISMKIAYLVDKFRLLSITDKNVNNTQKSGMGDVIKMVVIQVELILLPMVLLFLLIIGIATVVVTVVAAIIYNSPFSIFFPPLESGDTVMTVTGRYEAEFNREINDLINKHKGYNIGKIVYTDYEGTSATPSNYYDVMSVYMVKYGVGNTASVMDDNGMANLKNVFDDMCTYTTSTGEEKIETDNGKKEKKKVFYVNVTLKTYHQMETEYSMSDNEISLLNSLMSTESKEALGIPNGSGTQTGGNKKSSLSKEEISEILSKITDEKSKQAVSFALSKVGYPYSQPLRDSGTHFDCSSLAFYSWSEAGVNISYNGSYTAAGEAQWCSENKKTVTEEELKPGDLIFYSYNNNGRYKNISHVGIYVGDGKMVEAVDKKTGVVIQDYHNASLVMIGRPYKKK